jgi:hypothetical protein
MPDGGLKNPVQTVRRPVAPVGLSPRPRGRPRTGWGIPHRKEVPILSSSVERLPPAFAVAVVLL